MDENLQRLLNLRNELVSRELDGILIGSLYNRRYLSGFQGSAGWLLISSQRACLAVDFRYVEQSQQEATGFEILYIKGDISDWLPALLKDLNIGRLGIESEHLNVSIYQLICQIAQQTGPQFSIIPVKDVVESLRIVKDPAELKNIIRACAVADEAMLHIASNLTAGMTEKQVAWELECFIRQHGGELLPFEIIVASGPNSAWPHAKPTDRLIKEGEPLTIDLGARYRGYCSDMTRTFIIGKGDANFNKIYNIVLSAQLTGLSMIKGGINASLVDGLVRGMIDGAGYGESFGHGLGHGIGLETHESPRLGTLSNDILQDNMVFTVEPGVYLPGWGGVRIEDTVTIINGNLSTLTHASKNAHILGR
jgi:Xaa-Pro aminopeptidase